MRDPRLLPYRLQLKGHSRSLRRDPTPAERRLWFEFLRDLPHKFTRQKPLGEHIADFYCSRSRLVIEIDGDSHFTGAAENRDAYRTERLARLGLRVVRFTNLVVIDHFEAVRSLLREALAE